MLLAARAARGRKSLPLILFFFAVAVRAAGGRTPLPLSIIFFRGRRSSDRRLERHAAERHCRLFFLFAVAVRAAFERQAAKRHCPSALFFFSRLPLERQAEERHCPLFFFFAVAAQAAGVTGVLFVRNKKIQNWLEKRPA